MLGLVFVLALRVVCAGGSNQTAAGCGGTLPGSSCVETRKHCNSCELLATEGDAAAQYNLGLIYENGPGVPQDYAEAVRWYRKAADQGLANAQYNLGYIYAGGQGVPQDYAEAMRWYRKAADQGVASAQYNLGYMYANGQGVPAELHRSGALVSGGCRSGGFARAVQSRCVIRRGPRRATGFRLRAYVVQLGGV